MGKIRLYFIALCLCLPAFHVKAARGQVVFAKAYKSQCRAVSCQTYQEQGLAVCLGEIRSGHWLFATVGHLARDAQRVDLGLNQNGKQIWLTATVLKWRVDDKTDLAILGLRHRAKFQSLQLSKQTLKIGESVELIGVRNSRISRRIEKLHSRKTVSGLNRQGDSGGPVLVGDELVGIQWGHSPELQVTFFTPADEIRQMVIDYSGGLPDSQKQTLHPEPETKSCNDLTLQNEVRTLRVLMERILNEQRISIEQGGLQGPAGPAGQNGKDADPARLQKIESQLDRMNEQISALEPLLKRRLVLETEAGEVTADRTYQPEDPIRLRGIYRSRKHGK